MAQPIPPHDHDVLSDFAGALGSGVPADTDPPLPVALADELAMRLTTLLWRQAKLAWHSSSPAAEQLAAMPYMPQPVLLPLAALASHPDRDVRLSVADALEGREGPVAGEALLCLICDRDEAVRQHAAWALAGKKDADLTEALLDNLEDPELVVEAVLALENRYEPHVTEALLNVLGSPGLRYEADYEGFEFEGLEPEEIFAALETENRRRSPNWYSTARYLAATALTGRDGPRVTRALLGLLRDKDRDVLTGAIEALSVRKGTAVAKALVGLLSAAESHTRQGAAQALAGHAGAKVTKALLNLLSDPDRHVPLAYCRSGARQAATKAANRYRARLARGCQRRNGMVEHIFDPRYTRETRRFAIWRGWRK